MRTTLTAALLALSACTDEPAAGDAADGAGTGGDPAVEVIPETPDVPERVEVGDFSIKGRLLVDRSDQTVDDGLCVEAIDQRDLALGLEPTVLAGTTADGAGAFTLNALPQSATTGFAIRAHVCGGDTSTWYPTMTLIPAEATATLGPGEVLDGQVVWVVPTSEARGVEAGLLENGAPEGLDDAGAIMGQIFDTEGAALPLAAIRGPDATRVHYDQGDDIWLPYVNSTAEGEARFASPGAPWALWTCRAQAFNMPPMLAGAVPGWITRWDFRASEDLSTGG